MILGRTDLRIGVSGPKFDAEADFEVRLVVALQKSPRNCKKLHFRCKQIVEKKVGPLKTHVRENVSKIKHTHTMAEGSVNY